jgi:ring-1,2-phenylacetyl-CoA epoxidase subunit PaaE
VTSAPAPAPAGRPHRRSVFYQLPVTEVTNLTDDAVAVEFVVAPGLRETFGFSAGQHLTVRRFTGGVEVRRSYSICSTPVELATCGRLRIGVRRVKDGAFSTYATGALRAGDPVDVLPPLGHFTTAFDPVRVRHYAVIAAGSGITPVLSLAATGLATEPASRFTVLYGNRYARSVMFADELAELKDRYPARLHLVHVLSREPQEAELLSGRLDSARLARLFDALVPPSTVDEWFVCGPYELMLDARALLHARGVPDRDVHTELFHVEDAPVRAPATPTAPATPAASAAQGGRDVEVTILLDGRTSTFRMGRDERVLDAALRVRAELPYSCRGGVCSTCRAKVTSGEVAMARNYALEPDELAAGYVLTCQSSPATDRLAIDYDA